VSELTLSNPIQQELISQFLINQQGFGVELKNVRAVNYRPSMERNPRDRR